jgi:Fur family transcriptional regulator, peroxide stress response regulator
MHEIQQILSEKGLRITPQRVAVMDALGVLTNHPSADRIIEYIRLHYPNIAVGTIYRTLETFVEKGIVRMVKTERDSMRYDVIQSPHHHLYCVESDRIEDFEDAKLNQLLEEYFASLAIPGFEVKDIKLQIVGTFTKTT